jgi:putative ABC transport system substrate-binding protein
VRRRRFTFVLLALAAYLGSFGLGSAADAQSASPRRIGVLLVAWAPSDKQPQQVREGLRQAGYVEDRDVIIEWRFAAGRYDLVSALAADLVAQKVDVILVDSTPAALAAKRATTVIPIVMVTVGDPVGSGLVTSLAKPGGNITGLSMMMNELGAKRLQLLKELLPGVRRVALLWDPNLQWHRSALQKLTAAARSLSLQTIPVRAARKGEIDPAFVEIRRARSEAVYVLDSAFFVVERAELFDLSAKWKLPLIYGQKELVKEGALISYSANFEDIWRRSAGYVDKILKGAKPGDLPIEQPNKFELVVNLKSAKALGITIPESILLRADEVIR